MSECPQIFVNDEQVHLSPLKTPTGEGSWEGEQTRCNGQQEDDEEEKEMSVEDDSDNSSTDTDDSFSFSESRTLTLVHTQNIPHINGQVSLRNMYMVIVKCTHSQRIIITFILVVF